MSYVTNVWYFFLHSLYMKTYDKMCYNQIERYFDYTEQIIHILIGNTRLLYVLGLNMLTILRICYMIQFVTGELVDGINVSKKWLSHTWMWMYTWYNICFGMVSWMNFLWSNVSTFSKFVFFSVVVEWREEKRKFYDEGSHIYSYIIIPWFVFSYD